MSVPRQVLDTLPKKTAITLLQGCSANVADITEEMSLLRDQYSELREEVLEKQVEIKSFDENGQFSAIFNLETGEMIQVDNTTRTYSSTQAKDYFAYYQQCWISHF